MVKGLSCCFCCSYSVPAISQLTAIDFKVVPEGGLGAVVGADGIVLPVDQVAMEAVLGNLGPISGAKDLVDVGLVVAKEDLAEAVGWAALFVLSRSFSAPTYSLLLTHCR